MTQLATYLEEILPEMKNVSRLFSLPESVWEGEPAPFAFEEKEEGGCYRCTCTLSGQSATLSVPVPGEEADPRLTDLHRKRAARRLCKQTAYELCRKVTGLHPAWGSMTGVRPTHLMYEALDQGLTPAEAAQQLQQTFDILPEKASLLQDIVTVQGRLTPPATGTWTCTWAFPSAPPGVPTAPSPGAKSATDGWWSLTLPPCGRRWTPAPP